MYMVCMVLGEKCNWSCEYCDRPKIAIPKDANFNLLKKYYPRIVDWVGDVPLHISGGETALVDKEILDYIFSFDKKVVVETNGLWFEKGYYKRYYDGTEKITYHCVSEVDKDIKFNFVMSDKIEYLIVVHHSNIHTIKNFIERYASRKWVLQYYYPKCLGDNKKFMLTTGDYFELALNFSELIDKRELIKRVTIPKNIDEMRKKCFKQFNFPGFDFVNGRIKFCKQSHSFTDYVTFNDSNFNLLIKGKLKSDKEVDDICKTCIEVVRYTS
jgi:organic radical activating enzyme